MKRLLKKILMMTLVVSMLLGLMPEMKVSAAGGYPTTDVLSDAKTIKGRQGGSSPSLYGGIQHMMTNMRMDGVIYLQDGYGIEEYEFEGETFYFNSDALGQAEWEVRQANRSGMSVSLVFLLPYNESKLELIDADSRVAGYNYYAHNVDLSTYGGRAMRAYWHYLMEYLAEEGLRIDNFVLGNEVNMPNSWHYSGRKDLTTTANKYADAFWNMYSAVREYTDISRCSISIDHSWTHNDEGRGFGAREFLHAFDDRLSVYSSHVDWCVSAHPYPAVLFETDLWNGSALVGMDISQNNYDAWFVDGSNLWVMTNYIKDTWGEEHRVMLTEIGFTDYKGSDAQAACLAYTYYAAMYDPMVDCFLLTTGNHGDKLNFDLGELATEVYTKIGNGNAADQQWIADVCLPIIGVSSWEEIIPNYGQPVDKGSINADYVGNINSELISFDLKQNGVGAYYLTGQIVVVEWVDGVSTVPKKAPTMTFKSTDGVEEIEVFVTPTGTNTYYFDRFIEGLTPGREYVFEITSGDKRNISAYRSMNVLLSTSPQMETAKDLGEIGEQKICYREAENGELRLRCKRTEEYVGHINSELIKTELVTGANGNYVSGEIVVVEWVNEQSTVPSETPIMYFKSVDGLESLPVFITPTGTNTYYFDRSLGDMDTTKEYVFTIESGDALNVSPYRAMTVTTAAMANKTGILWETATQYVKYRTDENTAELRIYAENK